jgi:disulfide bond formation protein DsbB
MTLTELTKKTLLPTEAIAPLIVVGASFVTLMIAHGFEHIGGLRPCALCLEQRGAYWMAIGLGLVAAFLYRLPQTAKTVLPRLLVLGTTAALAYGAYLAIFHTGVEQGWWLGPPSCTSTGLRSLEEMLQDTPQDIVMCDEIPWSLFGLSMAGYNVLIALGLTIYSALPLGRLIGKKKAV